MVYRLLTTSSILGGNGCKSFLLKNLIVLVSLVLSVSLTALCPLRCSRLRMLFFKKKRKKKKEYKPEAHGGYGGVWGSKCR